MFALSKVQSTRRAGWSLALLNAGLAGVFITILISSPWKLAFALEVLGGLSLYGWEIAAIVRARKRRYLDWGLKYFVTAIALLAPVAALGVMLAWPRLPVTAATAQWETVYGFLAFVGVITFAILGMLYKIVPFLVWYATYSKALGRSKVPSLADLYSPTLQAAGYWLFVAGILATSIAAALGHETCVRAGCVVLLASIVVFAVNIGKVLAHLIRPRIQPLMLQPALGTNHKSKRAGTVRWFPTSMQMPPFSKFKRFDVRPLLKRGAEPLPEILERVQALNPDDGLIIVAPFLPSPLIELLGSQGFASKVERAEGGSWIVYFWRERD